jgi:hypothetical protein
MLRPSRQVAVVGCVLVLGVVSVTVLAVRSSNRVVEVGFWFEPVTYAAPALGGAITEDDLCTIEATARAEVIDAFAGLKIKVSDRRDAAYRVRVVQEVRDLRFRGERHVAGESRAISGLGGTGAVSLKYLAATAIALAPPDADRDSIVAAIGRGIGRTAVHEFAHELLPKAAIHQSRDISSYEFASAVRREQFYGPMHWDLAWPLLERRLGTTDVNRRADRSR